MDWISCKWCDAEVPEVEAQVIREGELICWGCCGENLTLTTAARAGWETVRDCHHCGRSLWYTDVVSLDEGDVSCRRCAMKEMEKDKNEA